MGQKVLFPLGSQPYRSALRRFALPKFAPDRYVPFVACVIASPAYAAFWCPLGQEDRIAGHPVQRWPEGSSSTRQPQSAKPNCRRIFRVLDCILSIGNLGLIRRCAGDPHWADSSDVCKSRKHYPGNPESFSCPPTTN